VEKLTLLTLLIPLGIVTLILLTLFFRLRQIRDTSPPSSEPVVRADVLIATGIAVLFYVLAIWRLGTPSKLVFDEVHHVRTGMEYIWGLDPHEWSHPPLAKLLMAVSMKVWGTQFDPRDGAWRDDLPFTPRDCIGWRYPAVVFGSLALVAMYALSRVLFGNRAIAVGATLLLALDGLFFVHSRIGMTNIYTICFMLSGTLGTWLYVKRGEAGWLLLTGLSLGLALATRWTSLWAWGFNGLLLLWHLFAGEWGQWRSTQKNPALELFKWVLRVGGAMVAIPIVVYLLTYIPFVLQASTGTWQEKLLTTGEIGAVDWGKGITGETRAGGHGWYKVWEQQGDMWRYHTGLKERHPYESPWWSWPLMLRPTWYFFEGEEGKISGIWGIGNAFLWWGSVPAWLMAVSLAWREKRSALGAVALLGLGMWLCWGIKPRPLIFMHYLFEAIPFACLALSYLGWRLWESKDGTNRSIVLVFAGLTVFWFVFYYPLLSALPIPDWFFGPHLWLKDLWV
jgi:dolichyl-phosphate-mannose--protein O-mannosyl transferase